MQRVYGVFNGISYLIEGVYPSFRVWLKQAYIRDDPMVYISKTLFFSFFAFVAVSSSIYMFLAKNGRQEHEMSVLSGLLVACFVLYYRMNLPRSIVKSRAVALDKDLVFAAQSLYIQISSGTPIYDALISVADGKYGVLSQELRETIDEVDAGRPLAEALEDLAMRNPSLYFQRVMWHIVNTIKTGGNLRDNLNELVRSLSRDQVNLVKSYGAQLSPIAMAYMMAAVIVPSLGTTVLITLASLPNVSAQLDKNMFWGILVFTILLQIQFAMIIKLKRPNLIGD